MIFSSSSRSALSHIEAAALLEALHRPLMVLDSDGCVTYASTHARRFLGTPMDRLRGRPLHHLFEDAAPLREAVLRMIHDQPRGGLQLRLTESGSRRRAVAVRLTPINDPDTSPHVLVHLRLQRTSRRSPTRERGVQKLPENVPATIFAP